MAKNELDINDVAAKFLENKINEIIDLGKSIFKKSSEEVSLLLKNKYRKYLTNVAKRYSKTRTFFFREPHYLYNFYVPIDLKNEGKVIDTSALSNLLDVSRFVIVSGSGGSGKSVLLKHLFVNCLQSKYKIPVFIELRDLNKNPLPLIELIKANLALFNLDLEDSYFEKSLLNGHYIMMLDGLDEVKTEIRISLIKEIDNFTKKYSGCDLIITTRPEENLSGLSIFNHFHTMPLNLEKSLSLIEKLPAEEEIKGKFRKDLESGLFEKHQSFLSNPLLLTIMLLTYGYSADIPDKISIFYNQAYEALFQRHDALKGAYKRDRETKLDIRDFEKVLSAFCILTYDERRFQFTQTEALEFLKTSKKITGLDFIEVDFLNDILQSVCFLIQDGLMLSFSHRSFQEYFAARFIVSADINTKKRLLKKYFPNFFNDNVFKLVYDLDKYFFEEQIILPHLELILQAINYNNEKVTPDLFLKLLKIIVNEITIDEKGKLIAMANTESYDAVLFIFAIRHLDHGIQIEDKEYILPFKSASYHASTLSIKSKVFKSIYNESGLVSKYLLTYLVQIRNVLQKRYDQKEKDLVSIFFEKP